MVVVLWDRGFEDRGGKEGRVGRLIIAGRKIAINGEFGNCIDRTPVSFCGELKIAIRLSQNELRGNLMLASQFFKGAHYAAFNGGGEIDLCDDVEGEEEGFHWKLAFAVDQLLSKRMVKLFIALRRLRARGFGRGGVSRGEK